MSHLLRNTRYKRKNSLHPQSDSLSLLTVSDSRHCDIWYVVEGSQEENDERCRNWSEQRWERWEPDVTEAFWGKGTRVSG